MCHAMPKDAGTAKVSLPPQQTGPGVSLTRAPAVAASSWMLLRHCRWQRDDGKAPLAPIFGGVRGQAVLGSAAWLQPPCSLSQA